MMLPMVPFKLGLHSSADTHVLDLLQNLWAFKNCFGDMIVKNATARSILNIFRVFATMEASQPAATPF